MDFTDQPFSMKPQSKPIEERLVRRPLTKLPEVIGAGDDTAPEVTRQMRLTITRL